jgi:poly(A) polymerase
VAYTTDWKEDAVRRDFTINALYASQDGTLFDYLGGAQDIATRRVRFIGDPRQRIREDYLRILRFFRFHARYGRGDPDAGGIAACAEEKSGLKLLSGERVQKELLLLLQTSSPSSVLRLMQSRNILAEILLPNLQLMRCEHLIEIATANNLTADPLLRLAALLPDSKSAAGEVAQKLRLSNEARDRTIAAAEKDARITADIPRVLARRLIYRAGSSCFLDQLLLQWAASGDKADDAQWRSLFAFARDWKPPELPLSGDDIMAFGVPEGPRIGVLLREIEQWWVDHDFTPRRDELLEQLRRKLNTTAP